MPDWKLSNIDAESSQLQSAAAPGGNKGRKAGAAFSNADGSLQPGDDEDDPTELDGPGASGAVASANSTNIDGQPIQVSFGG